MPAQNLRRTKDQRKQLLRKFELSGLGINAFAREIGVSHVTLRSWIKASKAVPSGFLPVNIVSQHVSMKPQRESAFVVMCPGQVRVNFENGCCPRWLASFLREMA